MKSLWDATADPEAPQIKKKMLRMDNQTNFLFIEHTFTDNSKSLVVIKLNVHAKTS